MSASQGNGSDEFGGSGAGGGGDFRRSDGGQGRGGRDHGANGRGGNGQGQGQGRKKRRRQRPQRVKHRKPGGGGGGGGKESFSFDAVNRERIFQQIEGLLRQIREHQEEFGGYTEEQLSEYTQAVTGFARTFQEEGDSSSERLRNEYLRVRDKLSNALRN